MKERVTLTIEKGVLEQVDTTIDGSLVKNRSHAFELLVSKALGKHKLSKALILAGGNQEGSAKIGRRMPECMLNVGGKPILQHNIELLRNHGIKDIIISIGKDGGKIKEHFSDGRELDVNISYVEEKNPLGTAGPLNLAKKKLTETFVMLNADELKDINLNDMYGFHKEHDGFATIALTTVKDPMKYGVAVMNGNRITTFVEKPDKNSIPSTLINAGLYILEPEVIELVPEGYAKLENDVFPKLAREEQLYGYPFSGQWLDTSMMGKYKLSVKQWKGVPKKI